MCSQLYHDITASKVIHTSVKVGCLFVCVSSQVKACLNNVVMIVAEFVTNMRVVYILAHHVLTISQPM